MYVSFVSVQSTMKLNAWHLMCDIKFYSLIKSWHSYSKTYFKPLEVCDFIRNGWAYKIWFYVNSISILSNCLMLSLLRFSVLNSWLSICNMILHQLNAKVVVIQEFMLIWKCYVCAGSCHFGFWHVLIDFDSYLGNKNCILSAAMSLQNKTMSAAEYF